MKKRGVFITFEGGEGAGKGTQLELARMVLDGFGFEYVNVREPGGTAIGEDIRQILLHKKCEDFVFSDRAELLLFGAARAQIVDEVIEPALSVGTHVLSDRFYDSTTAYQAFGRGLNKGFVAALKRYATNGLAPDLTVYLDIDPVIGLARATSEQADRLEQEELAFHNRVREGFLWIAKQEPERFRVVEASGTPLEVHQRIMNIVLPTIEGM